MPNDTRILDAAQYCCHMHMTFDLILAECALHSTKYQQPTYLCMVGLRLGVWAVHHAKQMALFIDEVLEAVKASPCTCDQLTCVDLMWVDPMQMLPTTIMMCCSMQVEVRTSCDNPATLFPKPHCGKCLLVATYAWDANAFPGNKYWLGALSASGDPAAACCLLIPELQNPYVNTGLVDWIVVHGMMSELWNHLIIE
ncbi:hypothetical protein AMAG_13547 [Allomyces macrogynus ATCC 38327]|uniref:Uncharacterized protein n=1 Tax=Allomyces macrogynus (strain ATCC 38327) TaxID=578462 RepID=A0A0L0T2M7_ALLM3|nr:hypothetical protein AMAG_13547 [Allomyces macrogynus ATCC 38327]|eukprot:KNE68910.1 hypothetical protein AMAG_13547 [Allomyces macrogynus ATCC 38327]